MGSANMSGQSYKFFKSRAPAAHASTGGDDSITEVAQSPKRVLEVDLTNSPQPLVTTKLIPRTRPTPVTPLGASSEAPVEEDIDDNAVDTTHEFSTSDSLNLASSEEEEDTSIVLDNLASFEEDTSVVLEVSSEFENISYEEGDGSDIPDVSDLSVAHEEGATDDAADNRTPKKVVEIDLTASPANNPSSPPGSNHGCSVCLDSLRDIRKSSVKEQVTTSCGHLFCSSCIRTQLSVRPLCPVCRKRDPKIITIYNRLD